MTSPQDGTDPQAPGNPFANRTEAQRILEEQTASGNRTGLQDLFAKAQQEMADSMAARNDPQLVLGEIGDSVITLASLMSEVNHLEAKRRDDIDFLVRKHGFEIEGIAMHLNVPATVVWDWYGKRPAPTQIEPPVDESEPVTEVPLLVHLSTPEPEVTEERANFFDGNVPTTYIVERRAGSERLEIYVVSRFNRYYLFPRLRYGDPAVTPEIAQLVRSRWMRLPNSFGSKREVAKAGKRLRRDIDKLFTSEETVEKL